MTGDALNRIVIRMPGAAGPAHPTVTPLSAPIRRGKLWPLNRARNLIFKLEKSIWYTCFHPFP